MIDCSKPIPVAELFVGRKLVAADADIRLVVIPELTRVYADEPDSAIVTAQTYEVYVSGKLFATVKAYPKRSHLHAPIWLSKDLSDGKMRLRLVKKYTELVGTVTG